MIRPKPADVEAHLMEVWHQLNQMDMVVDPWKDFKVFKHGISEPPFKESKLTRIHNDRPIAPDNYRWVV
jgi:hypothetical protein